ncbi:MAG: DnaB-like helicase N-terminal domain-containing protein, partial [Alphaproteobacteria bacterium]
MALSKINPEVLLNINDNQTTENSLPQNVEAERAVIGALLNNNEHLNNISDFLHSEHFFVPLHGKIFQAISKFYERGLVASPVTLKSYFETEADFKSLGVSSLDYLLKLSANSASVMTLIPYAKDIYETSMKRKLIKIGEEIVADSFRNQIDYDSQR